MYANGYSASETKAAIERARLLIEQAEALGEPPEDPLILFQVLQGAAISSLMAFDAKTTSDLAGQFLALAMKQRHTMPLVVGHRLVGSALLYTGDFTGARAQLERSLALYDPGEHRPLAARFGQDSRVTSLYHRSAGLWILGYPTLALADMDNALKDARETGQAGTLMPTLTNAAFYFVLCGDYAKASALLDELFALAKEKELAFWQVAEKLLRGCLLAVTGKPLNAVQMISSAFPTLRATGAMLGVPLMLSQWAFAYAQVGKYKDAWGCIDETVTLIEATGQRSHEAEILRIAGEIALLEPKPDAAKAEMYFSHALDVARKQQAKSWELRAAMSMARLWRSQGKRQQARELLAPVYGWFTEGFDTLDLKEAKALLEELAADLGVSIR
jgi:predicted ATPase